MYTVRGYQNTHTHTHREWYVCLLHCTHTHTHQSTLFTLTYTTHTHVTQLCCRDKREQQQRRRADAACCCHPVLAHYTPSARTRRRHRMQRLKYLRASLSLSLDDDQGASRRPPASVRRASTRSSAKAPIAGC